MDNLEICIWGARNGYQIIHSESEEFSEYIRRNENKFDKHFQNMVVNYNKPFFFIHKNHGKQIYSYVTNENIDFKERDTYMVISIIATSSINFGSDLAKQLVSIWRLYAKSNITQDGHSQVNRLSAEDLRSGLRTIKTLSSSYAYELNDRVIEVDQFDDEFGTIFGMSKCRGEQIYFLQTPIPISVLNRLPTQRTPIQELINGSNKEQEEIKRLRQLISNKQSFQEASQLYQQWSTKLEEKERQLFLSWKSAQEPKVNPLITLLSLQRQLTQNELNELNTARVRDSADYRSLSESQKTKVDALTAVQPERPRTEPQNPLKNETTKESIRAEIKEAKNKAWRISPFPLELKLKNNPTLRASLDTSDVNDLRLWSENFDAYENSECLALTASYYQKITKASNSDKRTNQETWIGEVDRLKNRVISLSNNENRALIESSNKYEYLISKKWVLRNRKPLLIKLTISLCVIGVFIGGYNVYKNHSNTINELKTDTDKDGLVDSLDREVNTPWIADTTYHLSKYVDAFGKVDSLKTKPLCDCWKFPDIKDRIKLKCQENSEWFIVDGMLYQFKDGDFYSADGIRIKATEDNSIESSHEGKFPRTGFTPLDTNSLTTFTYRRQKYQIKQGFLSEDGMMFGGARWRYYENTWKKSVDTATPYDNWKTVRQVDIDFLLSQKATKVGSGQTGTGETGTGQTGTGKTGTGKTDIENPPAGADDQYWIDLHHKSDFTSDEQNQIKANFNNKNNLSSAGRKARTKVMAKIQD